MSKEAECRNCKRMIDNKIRKCPYCGILNPTVTLKDIFLGIALVVVVMGVYSTFFYTK
jgi:RNA polymerase subunit RPABC4/transcription elongation factor Spt4